MNSKAYKVHIRDLVKDFFVLLEKLYGSSTEFVCFHKLFERISKKESIWRDYPDH